LGELNDDLFMAIDSQPHADTQALQLVGFAKQAFCPLLVLLGPLCTFAPFGQLRGQVFALLKPLLCDWGQVVVVHLHLLAHASASKIATTSRLNQALALMVFSLHACSD
jgi:hypothetical protein